MSRGCWTLSKADDVSSKPSRTRFIRWPISSSMDFRAFFSGGSVTSKSPASSALSSWGSVGDFGLAKRGKAGKAKSREAEKQRRRKSREAGKAEAEKQRSRKWEKTGKHRTRNPKKHPKPATKKNPKIHSNPFKIMIFQIYRVNMLMFHDVPGKDGDFPIVM